MVNVVGGSNAIDGYVELHLHTNYSLLEGASHPEELIAQAAELGYTELAITDHDNLYGAMEFARTCKRYGIRPITGMELTLEGGAHLTLLAESRTGYAQLCRLASYAHGHHLTTQRERDQRRRTPYVSPDLLADHTNGLICLTGCRAKTLDDAALTRLLELFGGDNVYVELQNNLVFGDRDRNRLLSTLAAKHHVPTVATGNVHYHVRDRHRLQDVLVAIKHRTTLDTSHQLRRANSEFFLRSPSAQVKRFAGFPTAISSTREIADRCTFDLTSDLGYQLPTPPVPPGQTPDSHLAQLCRQAIAAKYVDAERDAAHTRLTEELALVAGQNLAGFFLIYHEVFTLAEEVATELRQGSPRATAHLPPGRGRGSSGSSIICYLIGLSHIDPIRNNLFLGRFLNDEMQGLPDIDLDFPRDIRARLFERVYEHWGSDHAALVATFPTYRIRSAIRDVGKALGLPEREVDRLAKFSQGYGSAKNVREEMENSLQFKDLVNTPGWIELIDLAAQLDGFPRHLSQHVGGMVISSEPLIDCVPIEPAAWPGRYICHWDKDSVDDARMVKIDFLGLGMLSLVEECVDLIAQQQSVSVDLSRIDYNDTRVYDRICEGDTIGVFQIESRAQATSLPKSQPRNLHDLAIQVAIIRPGPIAGGALNPYFQGREALRNGQSFTLKAHHESVQHIVEETFGAVLFQEQVVQIAMCMGGFTAGEAETFRRAMGRKSWSREYFHFEKRFITGANRQQISEESAQKVFADICGFAEFGFPKSHSVAFATLAYQSAWLKEYFAAEFYCALFNNWPMGFYPPHVLTNDAKRHGVNVLPPHIQESKEKCSVINGSLRLGLAFVHGVGPAAALAIVAQRERSGHFHSLFDVMQRVGLPTEAAENLIRVGACDDFGLNRRELLWQLGLLSGSVSTPNRHQLRLEVPTTQDQIDLIDFSAYERMATDYEVLGLSPLSHPMTFLRRHLAPGVLSTKWVQELPIGTTADIAGLVVCRQQPHAAHGMIFLALEDEEGLMNVSIGPQLFEEQRTAIRNNPFLVLSAVLEGHAGKVPLLRALSVRVLLPHDALTTPAGKSWS